MDLSHEPGCWSFLHGLKAYRRKKSEMAVQMVGAKNHFGYRGDSSMHLSHDSGYESLKVFSPESCLISSESLSQTATQELENSENVDPTLVCSPIRSKLCWELENGCKDPKQTVSELYETPRVAKRDSSLRRRLLLSKATSGGNLDLDASECSAETSRRKKTFQRVSSFEDNVSSNFDSPRETLYSPIATSTLKTDGDSGMSCRNWRISFAQQRSSTIDNSTCDSVPFPEVEHLSPVQYSTDSTDDSILSAHEDNVSGVPATPICDVLSCGKEAFQTPVSDLAANFRFNLCTPTSDPTSDYDGSLTEDSAFHSLSLDKSQDSLTDHEGSFQELIHKETPKSTHSSRLWKLERCRRLSTLRERGSQSEVEDECSEKQRLSLAYKSKVARNSVDEESEFSFEESGTNSLLRIGDLTGTPALRVVREIMVRSTRKRAQQELLGSCDFSESSSDDGLTRLIGRKMGLETIDVLLELKCRNLKHVLSFIFKLLDEESICSIWKVSKEWREMVLHDKNAYRRRKLFLKRQKFDAEHGGSSEDSTTRLHLLNRSALKSVQAQAFHTPTSSCVSMTPKICTIIPQSASKQQEYVKIAKTLFTDEALKPCPQCQYPAKYQPLKKRGKCSRKDCGFDFCVLCLCTFHGSKECNSGSGKRVHKKDVLPGSAQSKRNLRRL